MGINKHGVNERLRVWNGSLYQTSGGLTKKDLKMNKYGRIVSRAASKAARKRWHSKKFAHVKASFNENKY